MTNRIEVTTQPVRKAGFISIKESDQMQRELITRLRSAERENDQLRDAIDFEVKRSDFIGFVQAAALLGVGVILGWLWQSWSF